MNIQQRFALLEVLQAYKPTFETLEKAKEYVEFKKSLSIDEAEKLLIDLRQEGGGLIWDKTKEQDKIIESEHITLAIEWYKKKLDKEKKWDEKSVMIIGLLEQNK